MGLNEGVVLYAGVMGLGMVALVGMGKEERIRGTVEGLKGLEVREGKEEGWWKGVIRGFKGDMGELGEGDE